MIDDSNETIAPDGEGLKYFALGHGEAFPRARWYWISGERS